MPPHSVPSHAAALPISAVAELIRRLPVMLEAQYVYELPFQKKSLTQTSYFIALSELACQATLPRAMACRWLRDDLRLFDFG